MLTARREQNDLLTCYTCPTTCSCTDTCTNTICRASVARLHSVGSVMVSSDDEENQLEALHKKCEGMKRTLKIGQPRKRREIGVQLKMQQG